MRVLILVLSLALLAVRSASALTAEEVIGKWNRVAIALSDTLELAANGRCTTEGRPCRWAIEKDRFVLVTEADGQQLLGLWYDRGVLSPNPGDGTGLADNFLVYYRVDAQGKSTRPDANAKGSCEQPAFAPAKILKGGLQHPAGLGASFVLPEGWILKGDKAPYTIKNATLAGTFAGLDVEVVKNPLNHVVQFVDDSARQLAEALGKKLNAPATLHETKVFRLGSASGASVSYRVGRGQVSRVGVRLGDAFYAFHAMGMAGSPPFAEAQAMIDTAVSHLKLDTGLKAEKGLACYERGFSYRKGMGNPQDISVAADFYRRGCELKSGVSCYALASLLSSTPIKRDDTEGAAALKTSCKLGFAMGCETLGEGAVTPPAEVKAVPPAPATSPAGSALTWTDQTGSVTGQFTSVWGRDADEVYLLSDPHPARGPVGLFRTRDGGKTWASLGSAGMHASRVWGIGKDDLYLTGETGVVRHSGDGGTSWQQTAPADLASIGFYGMWGSSPNDVYVAGDAGTLLHTADRGQSWKRLAVGTALPLRAVWGTSKDDVFLGAVDCSIWHSADQGKTWVSQQRTQPDCMLLSFWGSSNHDVYAAAVPKMLHTTNGLDWKAIEPVAGVRQVYGVVWGSDASSVYTITPQAVLHSADKGASWQQVLSAPPPVRDGAYLFSMWGSGADNLYVTGRSQILRGVRGAAPPPAAIPR